MYAARNGSWPAVAHYPFHNAAVGKPAKETTPIFFIGDEAEKFGLKFLPKVKEQLKPDPLGIIHDSCTGVFKALRTKPRSAPSMSTGGAILHESTAKRYGNVPLSQGDYEWVDGEEKFSPAGHEVNGFHLHDLIQLASSAVGSAETVFKKATGRDADFWWTRRHEDAPWFAIMGYIASDVGMDVATLSTGETFKIGDSVTFKPALGGYLYCYANDAWQAYGNNRGSVALTVTRTI
jgi:hypothetical protein